MRLRRSLSNYKEKKKRKCRTIKISKQTSHKWPAR
jgi:hypothetical protein